MSGPFARANRLWFDEGRTARALRLYESALQAGPDAPAVLFQYGLALWGVDRFDEATALLLRARGRQGALARPGRLTLEAWVPQFVGAEAPRHYPEFAPDALDGDRFGDLPADTDWRLVADCAAQRRMFGVAELALRHWGRAPFDGEDAHELDGIRIDREAQRQAVHLIQESVVGPSAPLSLAVRVTPRRASVGTPTTLEVELGNAGPVTYTVNSRLLLVPAGTIGGEVELRVEGPPGYHNDRAFRVRAGAPGRESFVDLAPGERTARSWALERYFSLHLPGDYRLTVKYHNEFPQAPDGRPVAAPNLLARTAFHRGAPGTTQEPP